MLGANKCGDAGTFHLLIFVGEARSPMQGGRLAFSSFHIRFFC